MKSWDELYASLVKRAASAQLIIENTNDEILVVKAHYKPYWSLPGGVIEADETPRQTAIREVKEEVGLVVSENDVEIAATIVRKSSRAVTYLFVFRLTHAYEPGVAVQIEPQEIADYAWVSKSDVFTKAAGRHFNRAVKNWASSRPQHYIEAENERAH
jgi:8-oxo-dGTP diphosphatase